jgi:hypothetical protein
LLFTWLYCRLGTLLYFVIVVIVFVVFFAITAVHVLRTVVVLFLAALALPRWRRESLARTTRCERRPSVQGKKERRSHLLEGQEAFVLVLPQGHAHLAYEVELLAGAALVGHQLAYPSLILDQQRQQVLLQLVSFLLRRKRNGHQ